MQSLGALRKLGDWRGPTEDSGTGDAPVSPHSTGSRKRLGSNTA